AVRTPSTRFNRNESKCSPALPMSSEYWGNKFRDQIELVQIHRSPGNGGVWLQAGFSVLTVVVYWRIDLLESATCRILHYLWPGFVGLTKSHSISVAWSTISPERLVRYFSHVRPTHHNRYPRGANGISHSVSLG